MVKNNLLATYRFGRSLSKGMNFGVAELQTFQNRRHKKCIEFSFRFS